MKNIKELRDALENSFTKLMNDEVSIGKSNEISNIAGKMISSVRTEMEYNKQVGHSKKIDFMEYGNEEMQ